MKAWEALKLVEEGAAVEFKMEDSDRWVGFSPPWHTVLSVEWQFRLKPREVYVCLRRQNEWYGAWRSLQEAREFITAEFLKEEQAEFQILKMREVSAKI